MLRIKANCTQLGLHVEASNDNGETWVTVQLHPYVNRASTNFGKRQTSVIDPAKDRAEYLATLRARKVEFVEIRA